MVVKVDEDLCIGCGTCVAVCPNGFKLNEAGKSEPIGDDATACSQAAADSCPQGAITLEE